MENLLERKILHKNLLYDTFPNSYVPTGLQGFPSLKNVVIFQFGKKCVHLLFYYYYFFNVYLFLKERQRHSVSGAGQRERHTI